MTVQYKIRSCIRKFLNRKKVVGIINYSYYKGNRNVWYRYSLKVNWIEIVSDKLGMRFHILKSRCSKWATFMSQTFVKPPRWTFIQTENRKLYAFISIIFWNICHTINDSITKVINFVFKIYTKQSGVSLYKKLYHKTSKYAWLTRIVSRKTWFVYLWGFSLQNR